MLLHSSFQKSLAIARKKLKKIQEIVKKGYRAARYVKPTQKRTKVFSFQLESVAAGPPWESARELSLSAHMGGDPLPTSGSGEGDIITPAFWGIPGTTGTSLLRGTGGF
jgi:hypothetical protein